MDQAISITSINETSLTISFGNAIDAGINKKVFQVYDQLRKHQHASWLDIIPAYSTISIVYDVVAIRENHASAFDWMKSQVEKVMKEAQAGRPLSSRQLQVPVCYDAEFAWDAPSIAKAKNISVEELAALHASKSYHVFMIGFLPGFAYMGPVDQKIAVPRIPSPRTNVPAGSVGIAGEQTGIYPLDSPGGWNIIGKTPLKIFDPTQPNPVLFQPGDQVKFFPITKKEFDSFDLAAFKLVMHEH